MNIHEFTLTSYDMPNRLRSCWDIESILASQLSDSLTSLYKQKPKIYEFYNKLQNQFKEKLKMLISYQFFANKPPKKWYYFIDISLHDTIDIYMQAFNNFNHYPRIILKKLISQTSTDKKIYITFRKNSFSFRKINHCFNIAHFTKSITTRITQTMYHCVIL